MALYSRFKIVVLCALSQAAAAEYPSFEVVSGSCTVKGDGCVYSDNFGPGQKYSDSQDCVIKQNVPFKLDVTSFDVQDGVQIGRFHWTCYDFLIVNGIKYCGEYSVNGIRHSSGPRGVTPAAGSELIWHTDGWVTRAGFRICPVSRQPPRHELWPVA